MQRLLSAGFRLRCRLWGLAFAEKVEIPMWTNFLLLQPLVKEGGREDVTEKDGDKGLSPLLLTVALVMLATVGSA